jgi:hypothetical protein
MKKVLLMITIVAAIFNGVFAQDVAKNSQPNELLSSYYKVKDALVAGDRDAASAEAETFVKTANTIDYKLISEGNITTLLKDANAIAEAKDIKKQRDIFANLSTNMAVVAKSAKLSDQPVYEAYCPMRKASWLSPEKAIKNPYYGSAMLKCGEIKGTL